MAAEQSKDDLVAELIRQYKAKEHSLSGRERARLEQELWVSAQPQQERYRERWLSQQLGEPQRTYRWRSMLLRASWEADALWKRIDAGTLSLEVAVDLLHQVQSLTPSDAKDFDAAMQLVLESFQKTAPPPTSEPASPTPAKPDSGGGRRPPSVEAARRGGQIRGAQRRAQVRAAAAASVKPTDEAAFGKMMQSAAAQALDQFWKSLPNKQRLDEYLVKRIQDDFVAWVDAGVDAFVRDLRRIQKDAHRDQLTRIGRSRFSDACNVLTISMQLEKEGLRFGQKLSPKQAKKLRELVRTRHHARSRELHPDRQGGGVSEQLKAEYNAVQEARAVLEEYIIEMGEQS